MISVPRLPVSVVVGDDPLATRHVTCQLADPDAAIIVTEAEQTLVRRERSDLHVIGVVPQLVAVDPDCPCCALRLVLVMVLRQLTIRKRLPSPILIVADGVADVAAIVQTLLGDPDLRCQTVLDGITTLSFGGVAGGLVTGGLDGRVVLWDAVDMSHPQVIDVGEPVHTLAWHRGDVSWSVRGRVWWRLPAHRVHGDLRADAGGGHVHVRGRGRREPR